MDEREPEVQTINASDARQQFSQILNRVFRREVRVIVEKSGVPVAGIISAEDLERFWRWEAERARRFKILEQIGEAFKDVPAEEIEREVARAVADLRQHRRREADRKETFKALEATWEAFKDVPPEEIEREVARAIDEVRQANRERDQRPSDVA